MQNKQNDRLLVALLCLLAIVIHSCGAATSRHVHCGINIDPTNQKYGNPSPQELKQLNATWLRIEFKDSSPGPTPSAFSFYDPIITKYVSAGFKVYKYL
jgi:hypothetical protein